MISPDETTPPSITADTIEGRIQELSTPLESVKQAFDEANGGIQFWVIMWVIMAIIGIIAIIVLLYNYAHSCTPLEPINMIYHSLIRITSIGLSISLTVFFIKMLRSYITIFEDNRHKIAVIKSMKYLVGGGKDRIQQELIYRKLTNVIIQTNSNNVKNNEIDFQLIALIKEILGKYIKPKE